MSINRVVVSGNLTRDPELRATAGGTSVLKIGIAVNDRRKNQQTGVWEDVPNFFDVTVFGARGESLSRFLSKGSKVTIEGKLRWSQWETQEGDKRSKVEIIADDIEFMSPRSDTGSGATYAAPEATPKPDTTYEDDIPF
ncbi:MAG: single-stranded DNA-binding protein [Coriobacteriia bacterium]|nr:single-stranded DNA-binding protein [Coriobacteriia bacterium]